MPFERWSLEYFSSLQERPKWASLRNTLQAGFSGADYTFARKKVNGSHRRGQPTVPDLYVKSYCAFAVFKSKSAVSIATFVVFMVFNKDPLY